MELFGKSFIGFKRGAYEGDSLFGINPDTSETLTPAYFSVSDDEIEEAVNLAVEAFEIYKNKNSTQKAEFLIKITEKIEQSIETLIDRTQKETGLPKARLKGETGRTCNQLRMFANLIKEGSWVDCRIETAQPDRTPVPKPDLRSMKRPIGPVVVFGASNFPLAFSTAGGDTASALAAGNPVIVVAHYAHPGTSEIVADAIIKAAKETYMPDGVFSLLYGKGYHLGQTLVNHPKIKAVGFTGSRKGGQALVEIASKRDVPIPVFAEMSSVNPIIVLPDAIDYDCEKIAEGLNLSVTLGAGQFCTNPGIIMILSSKESEMFIQSLGRKLSESSPATMLNSLILDNYTESVSKCDNSGLVETVIKQSTPAGTALFKTSGQTFVENPELASELFGPSTLIVACDTIDELEAAILSMEGQLTATIHGTKRDLKEHDQLLSLLESKAGRIIINGYPTGVEVCSAMVHGGPFPATSDSRTSSVGTHAIDRFCRLVCFQDFPQENLPDELKDDNPNNILRLFNNSYTRDKIK